MRSKLRESLKVKHMEYIVINTKDLNNYHQKYPDIMNIDRIVINLNNVIKIETYTCTDLLNKSKTGIVLYALDGQKYTIYGDAVVETNSSIINSLRDRNTIMTL